MACVRRWNRWGRGFCFSRAFDARKLYFRFPECANAAHDHQKQRLAVVIEVLKNNPRSAKPDAGLVVALCTCPDVPTARELARGLVSAGLVACVNVIPDLLSIFRWRDKLTEENEALMVIKTTPDTMPAVENWLLARHPYDVPEVLSLPVAGINRAYLDWARGLVSAVRHDP